MEMFAQPLPGFQQLPVRMQVSRQNRVVVTSPDQAALTEYSLVVDLIGDSPLLAVLILRTLQGTQHQMSRRRAASANLTLSLSFFPMEWAPSDLLHITLAQFIPGHGSSQVSVTLPGGHLRMDPEHTVRSELQDGLELSTGVLLKLASVDLPQPIQAEALLVAREDTMNTHGRWKVRKSLRGALPEELQSIGN